MHETTIVLYDCKPLSARLSRGACAEASKKGRGLPVLYGKCVDCPGVQGNGTKVSVSAGSPRPARVAVMTIDGRWSYV